MSSDPHPISPVNAALITECYAAVSSGDRERIDKAIARLDAHMCVSISFGLCPCCKTTLDPRDDAFYCPPCDHLWARNTDGSQLTWYDRTGPQASADHTGSYGEADVPSQGTPATPDQSGKDAGHER